MSEDTEYEYHQRREAIERIRANMANDDAARERHNELAELHRIASEADTVQ